MINEIIPSNKLYLKYVDDIVGWCVFTNDTILKDETVELCYCLPESFKNSQHKKYYFLLGDNTEKSYNVLGFGMIYNHSFMPNIQWEIIDYNRNIIRFFATRDISPGEQLCHNYGNDYWKNIQKTKLTII